MKKIAILFLITLFISPVQANEVNEEVLLKNYVKDLINDGYNLFNDEQIANSEKSQKTAKLLRDNLHLEWMAKYSLGRHRRTLSKAKIKEFTKIYSRFVVKAYVDLTQHYKGERAKLRKVKQIDNDMFIVKMEILKPGSNSPIKVDYLVHQLEHVQGQPFKVGDIITEGISILNSQQAEFNGIIQNQGIDALIADLTEKVERKGSHDSMKKVRF